MSQRLVGREREVAALRRLLLEDQARIVTIVGPPGVGKTRLATEVARQLAGRFDHGTVFVDLSPILQPELVPTAVARTVGVREVPDRPVDERLAAYLAARHLLIVLDNFEQVAEAAPFVSALLEAAPRLYVLVTSRAPLRLRAEQEFPLAPLTTPTSTRLEAAQRSPAVALFVARAQAAHPSFALTPQNAAAVAEICVRLDGLPLAIGLAAARIKTLPPAALAEQLVAPLAILTDGPRDAPARHRTLRNAIAWSDELLGQRERQILRRAAVFAGGWTLVALQEVCADLGGREEILDGLTSLVGHSLAHQSGDADGPARFRMLDTIRQFALERLQRSGRMDDARDRHAQWALEFAENAEGHLQTHEQIVWLTRLDQDHENLLAALEWLLAGADAKAGLRLAGALWWFWYVRGYFSEGRRWLYRALDAASTPEASRLKALSGASVLTSLQGDIPRAEVLSQEGLRLAQAIGDKDGTAYAMLTLGSLYLRQSDVDRALPLVEESANLFLESGNKWGRGCALVALQGLMRKSQPERATALLEESVRLLREAGDKMCAASAVNALAKQAQGVGDYTRAAALYRESLIYSQEIWSRFGVAQSLEGLAAATAGEHPVHAGRLLAAAAAIRESVGSAIPPAVQEEHRRVAIAVRTAIGESAAAAAWEEGRKLMFEQAIAVALGGATEKPSRGPSLLSPREEEVAGLIVRGLTNREIGSALKITEKTAENHVLHIMNKLGVRSRAQIAVWAAPHQFRATEP